MLDSLDAEAVRAWSRRAVEQLGRHRSEINALNVFPVPDSDTGSNLLTTFRAADDALAAAGAGASAAVLLDLMAGGASRSAAGNSGFIASQVLRGLADAAAGRPRCDARMLAAGLVAGATFGRDAVIDPVEGTILTVAQAAADAAALVAAGDAASVATDTASQAATATLVTVSTAAYEAAQAALERTTAQLPQLTRAGVVDAGGRGLVIVLRALVEVVTGKSADLDAVRAPSGTAVHASTGDAGFEVQYLIDADASSVDVLTRVLGELGDSVVVVPAGEQRWKVHVHVDDVGAAIEAAVEAGRPHGISVVALTADDHVQRVIAQEGVAVVAIAPGHGLAHLFEREGVRVVGGGAAELPTVDEVVAAIDATAAGAVVLLPNAARATGVAEAAAHAARSPARRITVVPTRSPVQGLAAVAVHDARRRFDDDVVAMAEAAAATRHAEIAVAHAQALTAVGICEAGDVLGLIDGEVVEIGRGIVAVAFAVVDRLLGVGVELMTIVVGDGAPARVGDQLQAHVRRRSPLTDVAVYVGGQPDQPVLIGAE